MFLQYVIGRAGFHARDGRLLVNRAGDNDDRHMGHPRSSQAERLHAVEVGQGVIGQDDIRREFVQPAHVIFPGRNASRGERDFAPAQLPFEQIRGGRFIFQNQDAQFVRHCHCGRRGCARCRLARGNACQQRPHRRPRAKRMFSFFL